VNAKSTKRQSRTDWKRIDAMRDEDIDFSDSPELGPDFFKNAIIWPGPKEQITLRLDPDILMFFRKHGRGYQTTMNAVLRKYMEGRKAAQSKQISQRITRKAGSSTALASLRSGRNDRSAS
jgi:uncharacterized protein (DUF4415 family)